VSARRVFIVMSFQSASAAEDDGRSEWLDAEAGVQRTTDTTTASAVTTTAGSRRQLCEVR
jgi:hypothetical protein